jgi:hypothetical protein
VIYKGTDLAWAAGFLQGEGCFLINLGREGRNARPKVTATQTEQAPIVRLQELFGGCVNYAPARGNHRETWCWTGSTRFCQELLPKIVPYLCGDKAMQAAYLADFANSLQPSNGVRLNEDEIHRRFGAQEELSLMKGINAHAV